MQMQLNMMVYVAAKMASSKVETTAAGVGAGVPVRVPRSWCTRGAR